MLFAYETERLLLKIIKPDQADAVLDFYMRDKELFEKFEPDRMPNFYTRQFQRQMLLFEYNMAVQGTLFRFYVYEKEHPERIIGTICVHHITRGFSEQCEVGYKFFQRISSSRIRNGITAFYYGSGVPGFKTSPRHGMGTSG